MAKCLSCGVPIESAVTWIAVLQCAGCAGPLTVVQADVQNEVEPGVYEIPADLVGDDAAYFNFRDLTPEEQAMAALTTLFPSRPAMDEPSDAEFAAMVAASNVLTASEVERRWEAIKWPEPSRSVKDLMRKVSFPFKPVLYAPVSQTAPEPAPPPAPPPTHSTPVRVVPPSSDPRLGCGEWMP